MVQARFPETRIASLHSGLKETDRLENWLAARLRCGASRPRYKARRVHAHAATGLIVVDEEHDGSLKQTAGFCDSARPLSVAPTNATFR